MFAPIVTALCLASAAVQPIAAQKDVPLSGRFKQILSNYDAPAYKYPTQLTQDIVPKTLHSHNDYWRKIPFWSALSVGAISIEADVFLINGTLYIGHELQALTSQRTFSNLYIQPLLSVLEAQNPKTPFSSTSRNGVFDTNSGQTLYLWVDLKTDGATTWPAVVRALEPLRAGGWLTTVRGTGRNATVTPGPVTVIGTGNTPLNLVQGVSPRDYFWDAPTPLLNSTYGNITSDVSPIASTDFAGQFGFVKTTGLNDTQLRLLNAQIATAKSRGIGLRYWNQPLTPVVTRNIVWKQLYDAGVALLNVDDLEAGSNLQ